MNPYTDTTVYYIKRNGFAAGFVKYGDGEYYSEAFEFTTLGNTQAKTVRQLADWMEKMEADGYQFTTVDDEIDEIGS